MDIWLNINVYEGQVYTSTHLTRQGALIEQIVDMLAFLGERMALCSSKECWRECLSEHWHVDLESEDTPKVLLRDDVMSWRDWNVDEQWTLRDALYEITFDVGIQSEWYFEKTQVLP